MNDNFAKIVDVFFNGRPADAVEVPHKATIRELVRRGVSHIRLDGKVYHVECKEVDPYHVEATEMPSK